MIATEHSERTIAISNSKLFMRCMGQGTPTVVLESGLGMGSVAWADVQAEIASFTQVCAYDRAGFGKSEPGSKPRTSRQMVTELREMLSEAQIDPPFVLVGHSMGGLNARLFATTYPKEIAGIVLLDPSLPDMLARLEAVWGKFRVSLFTTISYASHPEGATKQDFLASCAQIKEAGSLPDVPLTVISAGQPIQLPGLLKTLFPSVGWMRTFREGHAALAQESPNGKHLIAESSNHMTIAQDKLVIDAVRQVVDAVRQAKSS